MPTKRFRGLTKAQEEAFERIACSMEPQCSPRTLQALMGKELVIRTETPEATAVGTFFRYGYEVPIPVHMEWCSWCMDQVDTSIYPPF